MTKKSPKKSVRTAKANAPQPAQLDAIRRLLRKGLYDEAFDRATELRTRYPGFKPLLALCWEAADYAGLVDSATLHAWDWSHAAPGSLAALEALRDSAIAAGFPALGTSAIVKLAQAHGEPTADLPPLQGPLGSTSFEQAIKSDLSRLYLRFDRFDEAIALLEGEDHPTLRNNLALARFGCGEIDAALSAFETNWRQDGRNLFALQHVARLRLWKEGRAAARELLAALRDTAAIRPEDAAGKMFGLLLLDAQEEALSAWQELAAAGFWNDESHIYQSTCAYLAGVAAWRHGDADAAAKLFSEARDLDPDNIEAVDAKFSLSLHASSKDPDLRAGEFRTWLPQSWLTEFQLAKGDVAQDAAFQDQLQRCDAHPDYLVTAAELGGPGVRLYAISILKTRALAADAAAIAALRGLLTRPCGPDKERIELNAWLHEQGLIEAGKAHALLVDGVVRELELIPAHLHANPSDIGLTPALQSRLEQMHRALNKDDLRGALRIAEELDAARPDHPTLITHIATLRKALDGNLDEVEALFRRAAELDPDYLFAQVGLAHIAIVRGDLDWAKALLAPLRHRDEYHFSEWRALLQADCAIAEAEQDTPRADALREAMRTLVEQFT